MLCTTQILLPAIQFIDASITNCLKPVQSLVCKRYHKINQLCNRIYEKYKKDGKHRIRRQFDHKNKDKKTKMNPIYDYLK
uniref:Secreted protein n=1 Tax=Romanomermis culicivorax TaxID=13658 RepID=A0A915JJT5_ROMCU